jgi:hypothetical protein
MSDPDSHQTIPLATVVHEFEVALSLCKQELERFPNDRLRTMLEALGHYRDLVQDHWPLTPDEKARVGIGFFAAKELDGVDDTLIGTLLRLHRYLVSG